MQRQAWLFEASCSYSHYFWSFTKFSEGVLGKDGLIGWLKVWRIPIIVRFTGQKHAYCPHQVGFCAGVVLPLLQQTLLVWQVLLAYLILNKRLDATQVQPNSPFLRNLHLRNCTQPTQIGQIGVTGGLNTAPISVVLKCLRAAHS